jgi:hypothetical protein
MKSIDDEKLFKQIIKDTDIATFTVREIKDADVSKFYNGDKAKFVTYTWFKSIVERLCKDKKDFEIELLR